MAVVETRGTASNYVQRAGKHLTLRLVEKALMPIVATASTAAATYAAKKGPQLLESLLESKNGTLTRAQTQRRQASSLSSEELDRRREARQAARTARRKASS
jgi:hypothetical protein